MKKILSMLAGVLVIGAIVSQADDTGTVSQVSEKIGPVLKTTLTWTTGTNNNSVLNIAPNAVRGEVLRVVFDPRTSASPTNAYALTLKDAQGIDILASAGSSLSTNTATSIRPGIASSIGVVTNIAPWAVNDVLTLGVTNAGNSKSGKLILYTR